MTEELQDEPSLAATPLRPKDPPDLLEQDAFNELDAISLREILDQDSRPTFIYDLDSDYNGDRNNELRPVFCNAALQEHDRLLDSVTGDDGAETPPAPPSTSHEQFKSWVTSVTKFDDSGDIYPLTLMFKNMLWTGCTIRRRWRIISGNQCYDTSYLPRGGFTGGSPKDNSESGSITIRAQPDLSSPDPRLDRTLTNDIETAPIPGTDTGQTNSSSPSRNRTPRALRPKVPFRKESSLETVNTTVSSSTITLASPENSVIDWTAKNPTGVLSEHLKFARSIDWAATPLGPMETWTPAFRELTNVMMRNGHPCGIYWGEELTVLYNEPYAREIAGNKHPDLMGTGFSGPFSEIWDAVAPQFQECVRTGKSFRVDHSVFALERFGYVEEVYFCYGIVPAYGGTDRIQGFVIPAYDTSYETINHRRMQTLRQFGEKVSQARSLKHFWSCVLDGFVDNPNDFPFALLYSISDTEEGDGESHSSDANVTLKSCVLEGSIGIPDGHPASPPILDLNKSTEGFVPAFREAMRTREPTILHTRDGTLPEHLLKGIEWRGFGDPCREAIIIPVRPTHNENVVAFLLVGMNPRRAYDEDYQTFSAMLNRQLATSLAAFLLFEDEVRRSRSAVEVATLQQEQIAQQLAVQTDRMKRMTELSPFGMFFFSPEGVLLEANDRYYEMTNQSRDDKNELGFLSLFVGESVQAALDMWNGLVTGLKPLTYELQLKNPDDRARDVEGEPMEIWILATSIPEVDSDGKLKSIMGSLADISHMKWVQGLQDRRLREAEETKRQQNEFIDITSHEMRNPLSAILVCADDIRDTLTGHQFRNEDAVVIKECVEAANNIVLCVQHQKSIVDDILTVSKLDSNLLHIIP
jgi:PAS domain-containing protein